MWKFRTNFLCRSCPQAMIVSNSAHFTKEMEIQYYLYKTKGPTERIQLHSMVLDTALCKETPQIFLSVCGQRNRGSHFKEFMKIKILPTKFHMIKCYEKNFETLFS